MVSLKTGVAAGVIAAGLLLAPAASPAQADRHREDRVVVQGEVGQRLRLTAADLAQLPQQTITVTYLSGSTSQTRTYTGPLLFDVLNLAEPRFDPDVRNDKLAHVVTAVGSDDYRATVAWGEFDPDFEAKPILVAIIEDGVPLGDAGPRLIVPGDLRGGRYVSDVVRLRLVDA